MSSAPTAVPTVKPLVFTDPTTEKYAELLYCYQNLMQHLTSWYAEEVDDVITSFDEGYDAAFARLATAANEPVCPDDGIGGNKRDELDCSCFELSQGNVGYALKDLNQDGVPELIILSGDYDVSAIYTLVDNVPFLVGAYWSRNYCELDKDGTLYIQASSGACDSYSASYIMTPGKPDLQLIEMVGMEEVYDEKTGEPLDSPRNYHIKNGKKTIISDKEADALWARFPTYEDNITSKAGLVITPLL